MTRDPVDDARQLLAAYDADPTPAGSAQLQVLAPGWLRVALRRLAEAEHDRDVERRGRGAAEFQVERCARRMHEFLGFLSVELPELHGVEMPRLADALARFLALPEETSRVAAQIDGASPRKGSTDAL